jgi:Flp pilus assembly secretin CpaC
VFPCGDQKSTFKMGVEVPVAVSMAEKAEMTSFQYRNVGTNIECSASAFADGRIRLELWVEYSSIASVEGESSLECLWRVRIGPGLGVAAQSSGVSYDLWPLPARLSRWSVGPGIPGRSAG